MTGALFALVCLLFALVLIWRTFVPARGLHNWERLNPLEYGPNPKRQCRRCKVWISGGDHPYFIRQVAGEWVTFDVPSRIPETCEETRSLLAVLEVMES